jgi:putative transposase
MPRQSRLIVPQIAVHIIQRGNDRNACFRSESDYLVYLLHLRDLCAKLRCGVHAYCLMTNHVHLLVTPASREACISLMRNLGQRYVQYFNRRHGRTGTLWEGRFRSCIAESARYVLACYRYIELNPVRAGMVGKPIDYAWSSHAVNLGVRSDTLISFHAEFMALGSDTAARHAAYEGLFGEELKPSLLAEIRAATNAGNPLAGDAFKARLSDSTVRRLEPGRPGRPSKRPNDDGDSQSPTLLPEIGL